MDEYISREAVVRYLKGYSEKELNWGGNFGMITSSVLNKAERAISEMPAADVQPVKHGRWEVNGDQFYPFCSNCKYEPPKELIRCDALSLEPILTKYCPNCGYENSTRIYRGGDNNGKE